MIDLRVPSICSLLLICCVGSGCGTSPATRYYTLTSVAPSVGPTASAPAPSNPVPVRLEPVVIPAELDRLELVRQDGPYRVHIADFELWAAPLDEQIRRILSDDLATRLPPHLVADPNEPSGDEPRRLLSVAITQFYADANCTVTLRADWTLRGPKGARERGSESMESPGRGPCMDAVSSAMPAAMSGTLALLADRLAAAIVAQPMLAQPAAEPGPPLR
jgi:uncharacterized lipoprotein YmbA